MEGPAQMKRAETDKRRGLEELPEESKTAAIECHICFEELKERKSELNCGHFFCLPCI